MEVKCLANLGAAREKLQADPDSRKIETSELDDQILRFRYTGDDEKLADLLDTLNTAGSRIAILREVPLSLEDAYMAISGIGDETNEDDEDAPTEPQTEEPA